MSVLQSEKTYGLFANPANKKIIGELGKIGAGIILFPTVETVETEINPHAENLLKNLSAFDWVVFPHIFAVDFFLLALERLEIDFFELDELRICAFGETVADRLRFVQVHSDVISNNVNAQDAFQALKSYEPDFETVKILIPKEESLNLDIADYLSETGAGITELPLYQARRSEPSRLPKLEALLKGGAIDEFIFSSPVDAANLAILFHPVNLKDLLAGTTVSAIDSTTAQSLREFGITQIVSR